MYYLIAAMGLAFTIFTFWFAFSCFREREPRAGRLGLLVACGMAVAQGFYVWAWAKGYLSGPSAQAAQWIVGVGMVLFTSLLFLPLGRRSQSLLGTVGMREGTPEKFNQKETIWNRAHVGDFGPEESRKRWALQGTDPFNGLSWTLTMDLRRQVTGKVRPGPTVMSKEAMTKHIKAMAKHLGIDLVGITTVKDDFVYSNSFSYEESKIGTGPAVTTPVDLKHKYIICLAREMDYGKIHDTLTPQNRNSLGEIGRTYYDTARVACMLAAHIRFLGYDARAHHLRNEQVLHVPHAIDAGLGEQGRHGYIITKKFGPRVRLSSVTTNLELAEDKPVDIGVQDFCENCKLCSKNCPGQSLPDEKGEASGYRRWVPESEKCFRFWVSGGNTFACTMCMKICPWNKPNVFVHKLAFLGASRSVLVRRLLYWISVLFYGRRISWKKLPLTEAYEMPVETKDWKQ